MKKVYLAGGFRSGWQKIVREQVTGLEYLSPDLKDESQMTLAEYGQWDLFHIRESDILFAYMESSNPSGYGLAFEIGFAHALNKMVVLVLEPNETIPDRYLQFIRLGANVTFDNIEDAIRYLGAFSA